LLLLGSALSATFGALGSAFNDAVSRHVVLGVIRQGGNEPGQDGVAHPSI